jgi:Ca2+/Na+ antiporter
MATTTKKSPKAKTKMSANTSKTSAAKARTVKATSTKKVSASKPVKTVSIRGVNLGKLRSLHMMAASIFVLLAVVAGVIMSSASYQLTLGHLAKDDLVSTNNTVFAPAVQAVYDLQLRWAVVGIMLLSAVLPILYLTKLQNRYADYLQNTRMVPWRWLDLGITMALMTEVAALLSGVADIATLKLIGGVTLVAFVLGMIAERHNNKSDRVVRSAYFAGVFGTALPWLLIASYAVGTVVYGAVRSPWYTYALYAVLLVGACIVLSTQHKQFSRKGKWADYMMVERKYVAVSMLTKAAFAIILIVGVR